MDVIKINRNKKIYGIESFGVHLMREEADRLLVVFKDFVGHKINEGQQLIFRRYVYGDDEGMRTITAVVSVIEKTTIDGRDAVYTTIPYVKDLRLPVFYSNQIRIKSTPEMCDEEYDAYFDEVHRYLMVRRSNDFEINDWLYYYKTEDDEFFVMRFGGLHNIFPQDVYVVNNILGKDYTVEAKNNSGDKVGQLTGVSVALEGLPRDARKEDTLTFMSGLTNCGKFDEDGKTYDTKVYKYTFAPSGISGKRIIIRGAIAANGGKSFFDKMCYILENAVRFSPRFNPFYYYSIEGTDKDCVLWGDAWWAEFNGENGRRPLKKIYVNSGATTSVFGMENDYWEVPTITFAETDPSLGIEEDQGIAYVNETIDKLIPDVIDMERFKYAPVIYDDEENYRLAKSLIFDFHFRKRSVKEEIASKIAEGGKYPIYEDGWFVNEESGNTVWWNGMDYDGYQFDGGAFAEFIEQSGKTSDLLGYLGFDDDDVYFRKSKVEMSFVRISFYTSPDPVEQKLLYYSTSFLDATALYGKYMKQSVEKYHKYGENEATPIVFYPYNGISARVDTEIWIKNEFNNLASSEGFNLYLFADDADKVDEGKSYRTIYMKIEFNHAGTGKIIPMIMWPKGDNDEYRAVTTSTFLKDLYIPVRVAYDKGRFVYSIPSAEDENGHIRLILFEPKLSYDTI